VYAVPRPCRLLCFCLALPLIRSGAVVLLAQIAGALTDMMVGMRKYLLLTEYMLAPALLNHPVVLSTKPKGSPYTFSQLIGGGVFNNSLDNRSALDAVPDLSLLAVRCYARRRSDALATSLRYLFGTEPNFSHETWKRYLATFLQLRNLLRPFLPPPESGSSPAPSSFSSLSADFPGIASKSSFPQAYLSKATELSIGKQAFQTADDVKVRSRTFLPAVSLCLTSCLVAGQRSRSAAVDRLPLWLE
jgi:hypothetical protein